MSSAYAVERLDASGIQDALELLCAFKQESQTVSPTFDKLRADYREVLALYVRGFCERDDKATFVAREPGGEVVGIICAAIWEYIPIYEITHMGYIPELYVVPSHRRRGIGKALLLRAEDWFRTKGMRYVRIETILAYAHNQGMYERCGYEPFLVDLRMQLGAETVPSYSTGADEAAPPT